MMPISVTSRTDALLRLFLALFWAGGVLFVITRDASAAERAYLVGLLAAFALLLLVGLRPQSPLRLIHLLLRLQILILLLRRNLVMASFTIP